MEDARTDSPAVLTDSRIVLFLDNKHVPKFEQPLYDVQISEDVPIGSTVTVVSAVDHDYKVCEGKSEDCACAEVTYSIENGNEDGRFEVSFLSAGSFSFMTDTRLHAFSVNVNQMSFVTYVTVNRVCY